MFAPAERALIGRELKKSQILVPRYYFLKKMGLFHLWIASICTQFYGWPLVRVPKARKQRLPLAVKSSPLGHDFIPLHLSHVFVLIFVVESTKDKEKFQSYTQSLKVLVNFLSLERKSIPKIHFKHSSYFFLQNVNLFTSKLISESK